MTSQIIVYKTEEIVLQLLITDTRYCAAYLRQQSYLYNCVVRYSIIIISRVMSKLWNGRIPMYFVSVSVSVANKRIPSLTSVATESRNHVVFNRTV